MYFDGFELPALIAVEREIEGTLMQRLVTSADRSSRSVREMLQLVGATKIALSAEWKNNLMNMNTPTDYEQWCSGVSI